MSYKAYKRGLKDEQLFMELTGATPRESGQSDRDHIDCNLDGFTVDVKGLRRSHKEGYILVEFLNVQGHKGWCNATGTPDTIAFLFPEGFYVVDNHDLYFMSRDLITTHNDSYEVRRESGVKPSKGVYRLIGRTPFRGNPRKDVFTYIKKSDLLTISYDFYSVENN